MMMMMMMFGEVPLPDSRGISMVQTYLVSEQSIVAYNNQYALELFQIPLQCSKGVQVDVIGWLERE
jgi:hypothetical protein